MSAQSDRRLAAGYPEAEDVTTVILIDDRPLTRQCLAHWLELGNHHLRIVGAMPRLEHPDRLRHYGRIDLAVLSVGHLMASEPAVAATLERLQEVLPDAPRILVSDREDVSAVTEAVKRGVRGYIPTSLESHIVIEAMRFVRAGGTYVPASVLSESTEGRKNGYHTDADEPPARLRGFTERELEVLEHLRQGKPNKIIAHELSMQESTVKIHVRRIMKKLKATNRTQAAFLAQRLSDEASDAPNERPAAPPSNGSSTSPHSMIGRSNRIGSETLTE
jgi:DNA-binding NarL/FixJ family response regulator